MKKSLTIVPGIFLLGSLVLLSACGTNPGVGNVPAGKPDSMSIQIDQVTGEKKVLTLTVVSIVQQLYTTIYALPQMLDNLPCPADAGPQYTLTFNQGTRALVTVVAERAGCQPVSIKGESQDRRANQDFWAQPPQDCPSGADKVAGKGTLYTFLFSQWSLPVLQAQVYEGSCKLIQDTITGQTYQGDQEFWNLVHRAPGQ